MALPTAGPSAAVRSARSQQVTMVVAVAVGLVLRWWDLGGPSATFDEAFTGMYSHLPVGQIPAALRANDSHPPLDYLLRHLFGSVGATMALRVPSAVFASLTLFVVLWWMWRRSWFGVAVVALTSVSAFQLLYAHQARMYALVTLCGTLIAVCCERWWQDPHPRWRWLMGLTLVVALFDHSGALVLAGALLLIPGLRPDGEAWRWRATVAAALAVWAVVWGPSFVQQFHHQSASWIPLTSVRAMIDTLNGLVTLYAGLAVIVVVGLALGAWALRAQEPALGRVWLVLFLVPFAVACAVGWRTHFLLPRTLAFAAWAPPLALAALIERARRTSITLGVAAAVLVAALVVGSIWPAMRYEEGSKGAREALAAHVAPGDAVAVNPNWLWPLVGWDLHAPRTPTQVPASLQGLDAFVYVVGDDGHEVPPFSGKVWVLQPNTYALNPGSLQPCGPSYPVAGDYVLACYQAP